MNKRSQFVRFGAAAALFALVPALGLADPQNGPAPSAGTTTPRQGPGTTAQTTGTSRSQPAHARTIAVNDRFTRALSNGCQYVSTLQGTLRELSPGELAQMGAQPSATGEPARGGMMYRPSLRYAARIDCPNGATQQSVSYTLAGLPLTWDRLQRVLEDGGRIVSYEGGPVCSYSPQFTFEDGRIAATAVNQSCAQPVGRGGGPVPDLRPPPGILPSNPVLPSAGGASGTLGPNGGSFEHNPGASRGGGPSDESVPEQRNQSSGLPGHGESGLIGP